VVKIEKPGRKIAVAVRWASWATLALLVFIIVAHLKSEANQVVGSPARARVTGTWEGDYAFVLTLRPDGTFTSPGLPPDVGTAAPVPSGVDGDVAGVWPAHGTWTIGPGDLGSAESVIFTADCGAVSAGCAGHPRTFELQLETNSPAGGGGPALFYYLDGTRDLSNQYPFVRSR
jgi:hypothetical protein